MNKQQATFGFFAGAALFVAFLYVYPVKPAVPDQASALKVSAQEEKPLEKQIAFTVLNEGILAPGAKSRKNYAIYSESEMKDFWKIAHGDDGKKEPTIDFKNSYVIVAFAGSKPTTGYGIEIKHVQDLDSARNVDVVISKPGKGCTTKSDKTSPYQFVQVPFGTESSLSHNDVERTIDCK